jgi:S-adenosylmethionine:tRNA ribosyltransferase-isomerase
VDVGLFDFDLPPDCIAQRPAANREDARLLVLNHAAGSVAAHDRVASLPRFLRPSDLLVVNNTRVFPARLLGRRDPSGGAVECLLVRRIESDCWEALMHPGQKLHPGARVVFAGPGHTLHGEVLAQHFHGRRTVRLWSAGGENVDEVVDAIGHVPLPPYIKRADEVDDRDRYQTVFARERGSVAAPTAGLHLTRDLLGRLDAAGVERREITLHVGYGTFQPVRVDSVEDHRVEPESFEIADDAAAAINGALDAGRRVVAVGTTTTRALESSAQEGGGRVVPGRATASTFIYPGFRFQVVGGLLTNFHLPRSSLLMLVCAFAGREAVLAAYREAVSLGYRFYSYGDGMLVV